MLRDAMKVEEMMMDLDRWRRRHAEACNTIRAKAEEIKTITARAEKAEAELATLRDQAPVGEVREYGYFDGGYHADDWKVEKTVSGIGLLPVGTNLYAAPVPRTAASVDPRYPSAMDLLQNYELLAINIFRMWDQERIEKFATRLLGQEWPPTNEQSSAVAVPDGWQLVPINPDSNMKDAACCVELDWSELWKEQALSHEEIHSLWSAMIAAAPKQEGV